jgi:hypothetical protein
MNAAESLTTDAILDAFATAGRVLPRDALKQAAERWDEIGPALIAVLEAAANGADPSERADSILLFGIYLMAQLRESRAFRPLLALAADSARIERILGDAIAEDLSVILARVYDGDQAPLRALIESPEADEFVRDAAICALLELTNAGRIDRDQTARYLRQLHATLQPQGECYVWVGWQRVIALLCFDDLVPLVEDAFARGFIGAWDMSLDDFHEDLRNARQASDRATVVDRALRDDGRFDDIVTHMADWAAFQPEEEQRVATRPGLAAQVANQTVRNPYRGVGRNDPCPCGSGKKFKKCCLDKLK